MDIIDSLFRSGIRQKILTRFFADESKRYYINEMARIVGTSQGTCRRELNKLVDLGLLTTEKAGNLIYYGVNKQYPLYDEFSSIIQKTLGIEAHIKNALQGVKGIMYAFLFGSFAKKELRHDSDIDLVIVGRAEENELVRAIKKAEEIIGREINYHLYSEREFRSKMRSHSFLKNIVKDCIIIAGDEKEFGNILKKA